MNCEQIQDDLSAYVDGELPPARKPEIHAHVAGCAACQRRVAELEKLAAGVAAMPQLQPAPRFLADVRRKILAESEPRTSWIDWLFRPVWLKVPIEALAVIIVAGFVLVLVRPSHKVEERALHAYESSESAQAAAPAAPASVNAPAPIADLKLAKSRSDKDSGGGLGKAETDSLKLKAGDELLAQSARPVPQEAKETSALTLLPNAPQVADRENVSQSVTALNGNTFAGRGTIERGSETITVEADDPVAIRTRTEVLAKSFGGRVVPPSQAGKLYVLLPAESVEQFKSQLLEAERGTKERVATAKKAPATIALDGSSRLSEAQEINKLGPAAPASNVPAEFGVHSRQMSVIEIKIVPREK